MDNGEQSVYSALKAAVESQSEADIIKSLTDLLSIPEILPLKNSGMLEILLESKNDEIIKLSSQLIADASKTAENRLELTDAAIIKSLISHLNDPDSSCEPEVVIQICRALGNLCYENDAARHLVTEFNGLPSLVTVFNTHRNQSQVVNITSGFLLNYLTSNESAQRRALDLGIVEVLLGIIKEKIDDFGENEEVFTHILLALSLLTENMEDSWFPDELCLFLVKILELSVNPEISEVCLELLHAQGENDSIKLLLAKNGLCELLFQLLEQHRASVQDEEGRALMKLACDLIVLILTGDESMAMLYEGSSGKVYRDMLTWLHSDDIDLQITGVLSMGNFARNDDHCIQMVERNGLSDTLLEILAKNCQLNGETRLQHALLSALRNLVIPPENKGRILQGGLVDIVYPLLHTDQQPVIFKLLGTLRMAIDGQEGAALWLASQEELLHRLVGWCQDSEHPGVRAESPRLLAWLIKHCHSAEPFEAIIKADGCVKCLVEMIPSPHAVMQNEALLALNLLCVHKYYKPQQIQQTNSQAQSNLHHENSPEAKKDSFKTQKATEEEDKKDKECKRTNQQKPKETMEEGNEEGPKRIPVEHEENHKKSNHHFKDEETDVVFEKMLVNADIGKFTSFLLTKYGDKMEKEVLSNLLTLLTYLIDKPPIKSHLKEAQVSNGLQKCLTHESFNPLQDRIKNIASSIDCG